MRRLLALGGALAALAIAPATSSAAGFPAGFDTVETWFTAANQVGDSPQGTAVADFDQDAKPDVVAIAFNAGPNAEQFDIIILRGDGFGNFETPTDGDPGNVTDGLRRVAGDGGNDTVAGESGNDTVTGGAGNDKVSGSTGDDKLDGGAGDDSLTGGAGRNSYKGGAGKDRINSRNKIRETVDCGSGRDTVSVDRSDRVVGCEVVRRG